MKFRVLGKDIKDSLRIYRKIFPKRAKNLKLRACDGIVSFCNRRSGNEAVIRAEIQKNGCATVNFMKFLAILRTYDDKAELIIEINKEWLYINGTRIPLELMQMAP